MFTDKRGLALSTASEQAAQHYDAAIDDYLEYRLSAGARLKEALAADPQFMMANCLRGYFMMLFGTVQTHGSARQALAAAEAATEGVTWREARHVDALSAWLQGDVPRTCRIWEAILEQHPGDLLALRLHHFASFWLGDTASLRDWPQHSLDALSEDLPGYGNVLGMSSFGLEESGDYALAEERGRRAVELNRDDLWAVHAVAHVLEMQARLEEGLAWLSQPPGTWDHRNPFKDHLWWHTALFPLELGDYDRVLELYDRSIRTEKSDFYLDIQNQASLLYRLEFQGVDVADRWAELADHLEARLEDHVLVFTDVHAMMALAAAGRTEAADRLLDSLRGFAGTPGNTAAATVDPVTLPLCQAILAFRQGDAERSIELLLDLRNDLAAIGGSHAQRDIFHQLLLEAAIRARRFKLARALLSERVSLRPNSRGNWVKYAQVLETLGEGEKAESARAELARLPH